MTDISQVDAAIALLREAFPDLDSDVSGYIESVLYENYEHFDSVRDVHDAVGGLLNGFSVGVNRKEIDSLCEQMFKIMNQSALKGDDITLDAPVHMASLLDNFSDKVIDNKSIWMAKRETSSVVDAKKLGKAEAKLKEKQEKKATVAKMYSSGSTTVSEQNNADFASVSQQIDRKDLTASTNPSGRHCGDIRLENFDISYGSRVLLQGANLTVSFGRRYGLVGRNGFGKTTLLRAIARRDLQLPQSLRILHVEQEMLGDSTSALESVLRADTERASLLAELASMRSSAPSDFETSDSLEVTGSPDRLTQIYNRLASIEADKAPARAAVILRGLGFEPEMQKRPTKEFSGGWRMRLSLAQALFASPDLLLLDEPTNMLDMRALIWLESYLRASTNIIIIVSHDRSFLNSVATDIIHLIGRRLDFYRGNYDAFEQARAERLLNQQREYEAQKAERDHIQQFIEKFRFNAKRAALVQSRIKYLERLPQLVLPEKDPKIVIRLPDCDKLSGPVVQLEQVAFSYVPGKPILYNVDLSACSDSRICIVGENGAGKTTLLRLLLGQLTPTSGFRHVHRSLRMGYFSQHHVDQLDLGLSGLEFLMRKFPSQTEQIYRSQLAAFNITEMLALQPIGSLSGGQKSRVAFAAMCMTCPNFLILDEPTNHLDVETIAALSSALKAFHGGLILVSHDERLIETVCSEIWVCTRMGKEVGPLKGSRVYALPEGLAQYKKAVRAELEETLK